MPGLGTFQHEEDRGERGGPADPGAAMDGDAGARVQVRAELGGHGEAGGRLAGPGAGSGQRARSLRRRLSSAIRACSVASSRNSSSLGAIAMMKVRMYVRMLVTRMSGSKNPKAVAPWTAMAIGWADIRIAA